MKAILEQARIVVAKLADENLNQPNPALQRPANDRANISAAPRANPAPVLNVGPAAQVTEPVTLESLPDVY